MPRKAGPTSAYHPTCSLVPIAGVSLAGTGTRQAERDFEQQRGYPYAMFYRETHAGASHYDRCIRLVQQAENQFAYYDYGQQGAKPRSVTTQRGANPLLTLDRGILWAPVITRPLNRCRGYC